MAQIKNPAVKRILQEVRELQDYPSDDFISCPLEDNIFEWQFAIRGPCNTEFEGGIYHGRIQLPPAYPFQPPSFMFLTPNGRFETSTKICLSISDHHPEHWQPSWSVRTALLAMIAFMPTDPGGALGSLNYRKEARHILAIKSREAAPRFGTPERQLLIDEIHQDMLIRTPPVPQLLPEMPDLQSNNRETEASHVNDHDGGAPVLVGELAAEPEDILEDVREVHWNGNYGPIRIGFHAVVTRRRRVDENPDEQLHRLDARRSWFLDDRFLTLAAILLTIAIAALLLKKILS